MAIMAQLLRLQIALLITILALSASATARPCRTFLISSYSFSFPSDDDAAATVTTVTEIHSFISATAAIGRKSSFPYHLFYDRPLPLHHDNNLGFDRRQPQIHGVGGATFGFSADEFSSLRDRTKDILSVVVALLFGVGCGALTAATMYLVWSMFSTRHDYRVSYDDDDGSEDEKVQSPKKLGYVKIPAKNEGL